MAPALETLPLATKVPPPLPPLEGYTFEGYRNPDGSVGTKNLLGITTSVHCVAGVVEFVVKLIEGPESSVRLRRGDQCAGRGGAHSHDS